MNEECLICDRISKILSNQNKFFVAELETGYVVVGDFQFYKGYTLFLCKEHETELHNLNRDYRLKFLKEMSEVAEAVYLAFNPKKLNYELLGNSDSHLHWHIFPRYKNDPQPEMPTWCLNKSIRYSENAKPTDETLEKIKKRLLHSLKKTAEYL